jgi:hypothetical protein
MRWFRRHIGLGSRLALFALAVQLVLSFGHVHVVKLAPASSQAGISLAQVPDQGGAPTRDRHTGANDFCAICATVSLVASSVLPTASSVLPPVWRAHRWPSDVVDTQISFDPFVSFQARAPPLVV